MIGLSDLQFPVLLDRNTRDESAKASVAATLALTNADSATTNGSRIRRLIIHPLWAIAEKFGLPPIVAESLKGNLLRREQKSRATLLHPRLEAAGSFRSVSQEQPAECDKGEFPRFIRLAFRQRINLLIRLQP